MLGTFERAHRLLEQPPDGRPWVTLDAERVTPKGQAISRGPRAPSGARKQSPHGSGKRSPRWNVDDLNHPFAVARSTEEGVGTIPAPLWWPGLTPVSDNSFSEPSGGNPRPLRSVTFFAKSSTDGSFEGMSLRQWGCALLFLSLAFPKAVAEFFDLGLQIGALAILLKLHQMIQGLLELRGGFLKFIRCDQDVTGDSSGH